MEVDDSMEVRLIGNITFKTKRNWTNMMAVTSKPENKMECKKKFNDQKEGREQSRNPL